MTHPYVVYHGTNGTTVVGHRVICFNVSTSAAKAALVEAGFEPDLSNVVDVATYRAHLAQATQDTIADVNLAVDEMGESAETLKLRNLLLLTHSAIAEMTSELARENDLEAEAIKLIREQKEREEQERKAASAARAAMLKQQERQQAAARAEADQRLDRRYSLNMDGSLDITEATFENGKTYRKLVKRYAPGTAPPEVLARVQK